MADDDTHTDGSNRISRRSVLKGATVTATGLALGTGVAAGQTAQPVVDGLWGYTAKHEPAGVTVHHDADHPTNLLLPVVEPDEPIGDAPDGCGIPNGFPCDGPPADPAADASTGLSFAALGEGVDVLD